MVMCNQQFFFSLWPQYVRDRLHTTYGYFGASCVLTALTAAAVFRSPRLLELTTRNGWLVSQ